MKAQKTLKQLQAELKRLASPAKAEQCQRYFKTGPGEYGEGDLFLGLTVPQLHALSKEGLELSQGELQILLDSKWHEERLIALMILVLQAEKTMKMSPASARPAVDFYLKNTSRINNWDLVDSSASYLLGSYLLKTGEDRMLLKKLAKSPLLWERRIAVISTHAFIRAGEFEDTFTLCEQLMKDPHDLMHKAMGWMLREIGKKEEAALERFLEEKATVMPRTMLRYAIERLPEVRRQYYLKKR